MHLHVYMLISNCKHLYTCVYVQPSFRLDLYTYISLCSCKCSLYIPVDLKRRLDVHAYIHVCIDACMHVYKRAYMIYICIYIYPPLSLSLSCPHLTVQFELSAHRHSHRHTLERRGVHSAVFIDLSLTYTQTHWVEEACVPRAPQQ